MIVRKELQLKTSNNAEQKIIDFLKNSLGVSLDDGEVIASILILSGRITFRTIKGVE